MSAVSAASEYSAPIVFSMRPVPTFLPLTMIEPVAPFVRAAVVVEFEDQVHPARSQRLGIVDFVAFAHRVSENGS